MTTYDAFMNCLEKVGRPVGYCSIYIENSEKYEKCVDMLLQENNEETRSNVWSAFEKACSSQNENDSDMCSTVINTQDYAFNPNLYVEYSISKIYTMYIHPAITLVSLFVNVLLLLVLLKRIPKNPT